MNDKIRSFNRITLNIQDAVVLMDPRGCISYWSEGAENIFGWSREEVINQSIHELLAPQKYLEAFRKGFTEFSQSGGGPAINKVIEVSARHKSGHEIPVELRLGSFLISGEWYAVGVIRDLALKQQLEFQFLHAERVESIGTLAGGFAHDFNNILASIIGYTELAMDDAKEGTLLYTNLEEVLTASDRAKDLIQQILKFSKELYSESRPVHIKSILHDTLKLIRSSFPPAIEIKTNLQSESIVQADPARIHQMILNLCSNAGMAMPDGGILTVSLHDVDTPTGNLPSTIAKTPMSYVKLSINDTGTGMDTETLSRAFTPFFTTRKQGEGKGMGLPVVHGIVSNLKGWIDPQSEPGKGSTFVIYIPTLVTEKNGTSENRESQSQGDGYILFVDDELPIIQVSKHILERMGYKVDAQASSIDALQLFKASPQRFNLVITDLSMPVMNGMDMAREMHRIRPEMPIILCTGYGHTIEDKDAQEAGIKAVVTKPILSRQITEIIGRLLTS